MAEQSFRKAYKAGVPIIFGSGATSASVPHGKQGNQFAYYVKWGMTPVEALKTPFLTTAAMLNYNWMDRIGSIDKGKFADLVAVSGNPLCGHHRDGAGEVRHEGRRGRSQRSCKSPGKLIDSNQSPAIGYPHPIAATTLTPGCPCFRPSAPRPAA